MIEYAQSATTHRYHIVALCRKSIMRGCSLEQNKKPLVKGALVILQVSITSIISD